MQKWKIGCIQNQVDPCILYKQDGTGQLKLTVAVYIDDVLISGKEQEIRKFKTTFKDTYKITELGKLKRHLGI